MSLMNLLELGMFVWVVDELGHRRRVRVKDESERQRLLAKNKVLRAKLAKRKITKKKVAKKK